jgi:large subunit ribosomal protein L29
MMELAKIRSLSDDELVHQETTSAEQLFRLRFQVSMGQNDGVKKLRQLRKEIAQIKTVARERELSIRGAAHDTAPAIAKTAAKKATVARAKTGAKKSVSAKKSTSAKTSTKASAKKGAGK